MLDDDFTLIDDDSLEISVESDLFGDLPELSEAEAEAKRILHQDKEFLEHIANLKAENIKIERELQTLEDELTVNNTQFVKSTKYSGEEMFPRQRILDIFKSLHVMCKFRPCVLKPGFGNYQFDFGVYRKQDDLAFLIEYEGPRHYDVELSSPMDIVYGYMANVKKTQAIAQAGLPVLHINKFHLPVLPDIFRVWVWQFIDNLKIRNKYISMIMMYDKYGWTFSHYISDNNNDNVRKFFDIRHSFIDTYGEINYFNWNKFFKYFNSHKS